MTTSNTSPAKAGFLSARRLTLLGSVAGLGIAILSAGPGGYHRLALHPLSVPVQAAEAAPHPASLPMSLPR